MRTKILVPILVLHCAIYVAAQTPTSPGTVSTVNSAQLDFAVPESSAFTVLDVTPTTITRPTTPSELASSLLNGVDKNGNFQTGIALDFAPYMLAQGGQIGINAYNANCKMSAVDGLNHCGFSLLRFATRTQISVGTTKGASANDKSSKLAVGAKLTIFDFGDPRLDRGFLQRLDKAQQEAQDAVTKKRTDAGQSPLPGPGDIAGQKQFLDDQNALLLKSIPPLIDAEKKKNWNRSSWTIAAAPSWSSPDGTTGSYGWNGGGVWTSIGYGFEQLPGLRDSSELIGYFRYRSRETLPITAPTATSPIVTQNSDYGGVQLLLGANSFHGSVESIYVDNRPSTGTREHYVQTTLAAEKQIASGLWFHIGVGGQSGRANGKGQLFVLSSFNWGSSKEAQIKTGQ